MKNCVKNVKLAGIKINCGNKSDRYHEIKTKQHGRKKLGRMYVTLCRLWFRVGPWSPVMIFSSRSPLVFHHHMSELLIYSQTLSTSIKCAMLLIPPMQLIHKEHALGLVTISIKYFVRLYEHINGWNWCKNVDKLTGKNVNVFDFFLSYLQKKQGVG